MAQKNSTYFYDFTDKPKKEQSMSNRNIQVTRAADKPLVKKVGRKLSNISCRYAPNSHNNLKQWDLVEVSPKRVSISFYLRKQYKTSEIASNLSQAWREYCWNQYK